MESVPLRRCSTCKLEKPWTLEFYAAKGSRLRGTCRQCKKARIRASYREVHPDGFAERDRALELASLGLLRCHSCQKNFPNTEEHFYRDKRHGRLKAECKTCLCSRTVKNKRIALKDEIRGPILRAKINEMQARYYQLNSIREKESRRQWRIANADKIRLGRQTEESKAKWREYRKKYVRLYPERVAASNAKVKAARLQAEGEYTGHDVRDCFRVQKGLCYYCGVKIGKNAVGWEVDHFIPLSRGGTNLPENIVVACKSCNRRKYNFMPWEWLPGRFSAPYPQAAD